MDEPKRRPGRPKGVPNKTGTVEPPALNTPTPMGDYHHPDPDSIVSRQLTLLDWAQQAMRNEMQRRMQGKGVSIELADIQKLEKLSNAIVRAIEALKKSSDLSEELANRLTPEQLLEAALKKIEGQDLATVTYAIKRLRAHRERLQPTASDATPDDKASAVDVIVAMAKATNPA